MSVYHDAINHYGSTLQILKAAEKHAEYAAELTQYGLALLQGKRPKNANQLAEERADCEIMDRQMNIIFADSNGAKTEWKRRKLERLSKMITQETERITVA